MVVTQGASYAPTHYMHHVPIVATRLARDAKPDVHAGNGRGLWIFMISWWGLVETNARKHAWDVLASRDAVGAADVLAAQLYALEALARTAVHWSPHKRCERLAQGDAALLEAREGEYGSSWKQRGGAGAFFACVRKWDRIRMAIETPRRTTIPFDHDVEAGDAISVVSGDSRPGGLVDDVADLRRYLILWISESAARCCGPLPPVCA